MTEAHKYTDEVMAALRLKVADRGDDTPTVPQGHIRYHIAVEQTLLSGTAPSATVAASLRALADQIDPPKRPMRRSTTDV